METTPRPVSDQSVPSSQDESPPSLIPACTRCCCKAQAIDTWTVTLQNRRDINKYNESRVTRCVYMCGGGKQKSKALIAELLIILFFIFGCRPFYGGICDILCKNSKVMNCKWLIVSRQRYQLLASFQDHLPFASNLQYAINGKNNLKDTRAWKLGNFLVRRKKVCV